MAHTPQLESVEVSLLQALGKVLAEDVDSPNPFPPFPASIKDGYAVVASDGPGEYAVVGSFRASAIDRETRSLSVTSGTVAYVTTGAPVPTGADAVIGIEKTSAIESSSVSTASSGVKRVRLTESVKAGADSHGRSMPSKAPSVEHMLATNGRCPRVTASHHR